MAEEATDADAWDAHLARLRAEGISAPAAWFDGTRKPPTLKDERSLYEAGQSFVELLPWVEYLTGSQCMLLDDGQSVAAFFELIPIGTEGRESEWLQQARDAIENALQDSLEELEDSPWVVQIYAQDEANWDEYLRALRAYIHPRARGTAFTEFYLRLIEDHLHAVSTPGGLFVDNAVTQLPWRGQMRRVRMVVYRRVTREGSRRGESAEDALSTTCDRLIRAVGNAGIRARRMAAADTHAWLLAWFNPKPTLLGTSDEDQKRFRELTAYPLTQDSGDLELASGTDFSARLFFREPRSDVREGVWYFDGMPHRAVVVERLRSIPSIGQVTGETRLGGDAINAVFDQMPEGTVMCITVVATPQDALEAHLNYLAKKAVGDTLASEQTRQDVQQARTLIGSSHKLYRGAIAFYLRAQDLPALDASTRRLNNVLLNAGLQPVRHEDEVAPLNSYLRWLPCMFNPAFDRRHWYTQLMFAQHIANLLPVWGRTHGTGHPGLTFFNRGGGLITCDPFSRLDRQMNAHLLLLGPTGSGKSAAFNNMLVQVMAIYRPRLFMVEAGNSFGLFGDFARRLGLSVHRVTLAPGAGVTLAPFADARRLIETPHEVESLDVDAVDESDTSDETSADSDHRDILGELEITARLMITGGEEKEETRMTRADRSLIRQCILDAARRCAALHRPVLTQDVREALRARGADPALPEVRRSRLMEMADAIDVFCQGANGELFNRPGTPWPEADVTIVDLALFAKEGYSAELSAAYISLVNTVTNIAERDQYLGRDIVFATDEGHIITTNPLTAPRVIKGSKMWRKLGLWYWLATTGLADFPEAAEPMLNMSEWWICLSMPPDEVARVSRFRNLTAEQRTLLLSARKEMGKYSEGVVLAKSVEALIRIVSASLILALSMTETSEKNQRHELMKQYSISELAAAVRIAQEIDRARGIEPRSYDELA